jgi:hypothetical protein
MVASDLPATLPVKGANTSGKSSYSISALGNFIPFSTLSNVEIARLIEDYEVIFHATEHKKEQIIQDIKNMEFKNFRLFWRAYLWFWKTIVWYRGILMSVRLWFIHENFKLEFMRCRSSEKRHYLKEFLKREHIDVVCLQETKIDIFF